MNDHRSNHRSYVRNLTCCDKTEKKIRFERAFGTWRTDVLLHHQLSSQLGVGYFVSLQ